MARPRLFEPGEKSSINIYMHPEQKDWLIKVAREQGKNPSAFVRQLLEKEKETLRATGS